ncbi:MULTISPECIES: hypothetical protein [Paraburkholderia]|uniref:hypothetical protein n=1 Tax=Paraburkholderia TaxID=1822464 RepID=UPI00115FC1FD|nr:MULTISPECIES: hypothetical protein [Paraburkholderia]MBC8725361.1 hypothetical protein [Paraburkholderia sp. 31.1]
MRQSERFYQVNEASHGSSGFHGSGKKSPGSFSNERQGRRHCMNRSAMQRVPVRAALEACPLFVIAAVVNASQPECSNWPPESHNVARQS